MEIAQVLACVSLRVVVSLFKVDYSSLLLNVGVNLFSIHLGDLRYFRHDHRLVVVLPEHVFHCRVLACDVSHLIFEVFGQLIELSEVIVRVRSSSSVTSYSEDFIVERNSVEIFNLASRLIIEYIFFFSLFLSCLYLFISASRLCVVVEEFMLSFV